MKYRNAAAVLACALAVALAPTSAAAQEPVRTDTVQEIELADGSRIFGHVVEETPGRVVVTTLGGVRMELDRAQIRSTRTVTGRVVNGALWPEDPHASRLFFGPTARAIPQGQGYFGAYELFFPFVSYGVTDRFTLSAGTPVFPEAIGRIFYLAPKLEVVRTPRLNAALGALAVFATEDVLSGTVGLLYGVGTYGNPDGAITVGATVPFYTSSDGGDIGSEPAFMIGGEARLSRRSKFLTENYFVPGEGGALVSGGIRFFGERLSADFGLGAAIGTGDAACCLPLVNFVYTFGAR
jgi:hypothetical protein